MSTWPDSLQASFSAVKIQAYKLEANEMLYEISDRVWMQTVPQNHIIVQSDYYPSSTFNNNKNKQKAVE